MSKILSIDPGTEKCGLLLADIEKDIVVECKVVKKIAVLDLIKNWIEEYSIKLIILGDGTNSKYWNMQVSSLNSSSIKLVNEKGTTLRARYRYWEIKPPTCLMRLIPMKLRFPPKDLDGIAALVLLEDYLQKKIYFPERTRF